MNPDEKKTAKEDPVNSPAHYQGLFTYSAPECIHICRHLPFCGGNAVKYVWRTGRKGGAPCLQDLEKARWYTREHLKEYSGAVCGTALAVYGLLERPPAGTYESLRYLFIECIIRGRDEALEMLDMMQARAGEAPQEQQKEKAYE